MMTIGMTALKQSGLKPDQVNIMLAVSGGPDSMAMAGLVQEYWRNSPRRKHLSAVIIDHGIRAESSAEAKASLAELTRMGIDASIVRITEAAPTAGLQRWARRVRYEALWRAAMAADAVIMTGHHADDQAETVQMRLRRGSGLLGLQGMKSWQDMRGVKICRPFLSCSGQDLRQYGADQAIASVEDASNNNMRFERVQLRHDQADLEDQGIGADHFLRLAKSSQKLTAIMDAQILPMLTIDAGGWASMEHQQFMALTQPAQRYAVRRMVMMLNASDHPPHHEATSRLADALSAQHWGKQTLGGLEWQLRAGKIWIYPEAERYPDAVTVEEGLHNYDRRWSLNLPKGGVVKPLGEKGFAALRKKYPNDFPAPSVPARAYWRWPVFVPVDTAGQPVPAEKTKNNGKMAKDSTFALEDGAILPHLKYTSLTFYHEHDGPVSMRFNAVM